MRGRVMSIYMLAFRGGMPLGSLASGYLATWLGAPTVIAVNGVLLVAVARVLSLAGPWRKRTLGRVPRWRASFSNVLRTRFKIESTTFTAELAEFADILIKGFLRSLRTPASAHRFVPSFGEARRPASAKATAVRRSFSEGGSAFGAKAAAVFVVVILKCTPSVPSQKFADIFRAGHPGWRRCSSLKYSRYSRSSRLAIRAPRSGKFVSEFLTRDTRARGPFRDPYEARSGVQTASESPGGRECR